jgi:uncharacterized coiled-coil protein SlyX
MTPETTPTPEANEKDAMERAAEDAAMEKAEAHASEVFHRTTGAWINASWRERRDSFLSGVEWQKARATSVEKNGCAKCGRSWPAHLQLVQCPFCARAASEAEEAAMEEANPYQNKDKCYERNCFNRGWKARAALPSTNEGRKCGECSTHLAQAMSMQKELSGWKELHDNDEACIGQQHARIKELEAQLAQENERFTNLSGVCAEFHMKLNASYDKAEALEAQLAERDRQSALAIDILQKQLAARPITKEALVTAVELTKLKEIRRLSFKLMQPQTAEWRLEFENELLSLIDKILDGR